MATSEAAGAGEWDLEKLREELQRQKQLRNGLLRTTAQMQQAVTNLEGLIQNVPHEDSVWRDRYFQQHTHNQQLESQLKQLERRLAELKSQHKDVTDQELLHAYDDMSDASLRQLLRRLEKEKAEVEWQLRDHEWRLDQEATAVHKAEEEKKAILTELGQASLELEKCKKRGKDVPTPTPQRASGRQSTQKT